jgi:hypothetical protein
MSNYRRGFLADHARMTSDWCPRLADQTLLVRQGWKSLLRLC